MLTLSQQKLKNASSSLFDLFVCTKLAFFTFKGLSFSKALSVGESENSGLKFWTPFTHDMKGAVYDSNPKQFLSNAENISSRSASFPFCVRAEKKVWCSYTALAL